MALQNADFDLSMLGFPDDELMRFLAPPPNEGEAGPRRRARTTRRTRYAARRPVAAGTAPAAVRRRHQARGRGPVARQRVGRTCS